MQGENFWTLSSACKVQAFEIRHAAGQVQAKCKRPSPILPYAKTSLPLSIPLLATSQASAFHPAESLCVSLRVQAAHKRLAAGACRPPFALTSDRQASIVLRPAPSSDRRLRPAGAPVRAAPSSGRRLRPVRLPFGQHRHPAGASGQPALPSGQHRHPVGASSGQRCRPASTIACEGAAYGPITMLLRTLATPGAIHAARSASSRSCQVLTVPLSTTSAPSTSMVMRFASSWALR